MVYETKNRAAKIKVENSQKEKTNKSSETTCIWTQNLKDRYNQLLVQDKEILE